MLTNQKLDQVTFGTAIRAPEDIKTATLDTLMADIRNGRWEKEVQKIRSTANPELAKTIKAGLPYFIYGTFDGKRANERLKQMNGAILDYDHVSDIGGFKTLVSEVLPWVRCAFRSPRDGVKLVVPFDRPVTDGDEYREVFEHLKTESDALLNEAVARAQAGNHAVFKNDLSVPARRPCHPAGLRPPAPWLADSTPDPARACFVSYDPELYENAECVPFEVDSAPLNERRLKDSNLNPPTTPIDGVSPHTPVSQETPDAEVESAAAYLARQKLAYRDWISIGLALRNTYGENGKPLWDRFADNPHYRDTPKGLDRRWKSFKPGEGVTAGSIIHLAKAYGCDNAEHETHEGDERHEKQPPRKFAELQKDWELLDLFGRPANVELDIARLPRELRGYLEFTDTVTDAQSGAKLTAWLPCLAANIGNRVYMVNNSARVFPHIWGIIIGPSSISRKTTVLKLARQTLEPHEEAVSALETDEYLKQTLVLTDVTMSKLLCLLSENPNRVFLQMEISAWLRQMNRHWNVGMKQALTDLFDGADRTVSNMERTERIIRPAFSIAAASTEGWFYQELKDVADQQSGFLQRFLFCLIQNVKPEEIDLTYREGEEACPQLRRYEEMYAAFRGIPGSFKLTLGEEAAQLRNELYRGRFERVMAQKNDVLMSYFARIYDGYFFKFCILFTLVKAWRELAAALGLKERKERNEEKGPGSLKHLSAKGRARDFFAAHPVTAETVEQAFALCGYYFENTRPFLANLSENMKLANERKLVSFLCRFPNGVATHSQLMVKARLPKREFKEAIECLIEKEAVNARSAQAANGNIAKTYFLHPDIHRSWSEE